MRVPIDAALERDLRVITAHRVLRRTPFWMPVFFLYFTERFSVGAALALGGMYYLVVFVTEVPSGYASDRLGRVPLLRLSAGLEVAAMALFVFGAASLTAFAAAQCCMALSFAFESGTDQTLHFDTLAATGREEEFADREAAISRLAHLGVAVGALGGGILGVFDLRWAYVAALMVALTTLGVTGFMREPASHRGDATGETFTRQLRTCLGYLRRPWLGWLFTFVVVQLTIEHIPYELAQPYVAEALDRPLDDLGPTALVTGVLYALVGVVASWAGGRSVALRNRLGVRGALLLVAAGEVGIIVVMAAVIHPLATVVVLGRNVLPAVADVIIPAEVAPRIHTAHRATYFSITSLAGRLGFGIVLLALALVAGGDPLTGALLRRLLVLSALGSALAVGGLWIWSRRVGPDRAQAVI